MRKSTLEYVFGFGSIVNIARLEAYFGHRRPKATWHIARLRDHKRGWNVAMDNKYDIPGYKYYIDAETRERPPYFVTYLGIKPAAGGVVNGIIYPVEAAELAKLDQRERNYDRADVTSYIEAAYPAGRVWSYLASAEARERYSKGLATGTARIPHTYLRNVREGFASHGESFLAEFDATTEATIVPIARLIRRSL